MTGVNSTDGRESAMLHPSWTRDYHFQSRNEVKTSVYIVKVVNVSGRVQTKVPCGYKEVAQDKYSWSLSITGQAANPDQPGKCL